VVTSSPFDLVMCLEVAESQPYEVTARTATQDLTKPDTPELRDISKDGQHVTIKSINGVYNTKGERAIC
jgi:hypothetical protein